MAKKKDDHDFSIRAVRVVGQATQGNDNKDNIEVEACLAEDKNPHAVALGRLGGLKGGKARFDKLTPQQRREIAQRAAQARWHHKTNPH